MTRNAKAAILGGLVLAVTGVAVVKNSIPKANVASRVSSGAATPAKPLPKLVDLGAGKCIPCKAMAPILEDLRKDFAGKFEVEFIDVWQNPAAGAKYKIQLIPTQIFFDANGKELLRHEGFFGREDILAAWKENGFNFTVRAAIVREEPLNPDARPLNEVCSMCNGDVSRATKTIVRGVTEQRVLCTPHCYFIYFSSLVNPNVAAEDAKVSVTDYATGALIPAPAATFVYGLDAKGRATIKAFGTREKATQAQIASPGAMVSWETLRSKELATRCAFCDRAVYPEDASRVKADTVELHACCEMCALGVAARLQQNIEVEVRDELTGETIRARTYNGSIATLVPKTAIAWAGQIKNAEGKMVSAGCFKQAWFVSETNLQKWLMANPAATGREITIAEALREKMSLSREQIARACKLGECK